MRFNLMPFPLNQIQLRTITRQIEEVQPLCLPKCNVLLYRLASVNPGIVLNNHGDSASSRQQPLRLFSLLIDEANVGCTRDAPNH